MSMQPIEGEEFAAIDTPEYQNLDLLNYGGEADLLGAAMARLEAALPEWEARVGTTEMLLLESLAMMLGIEVMALREVPAQVVEQLMGLYGVSRDAGRGAEGKVLFTVTGSKPIHEIPLGTRLRYQMVDTEESFDLLTTEGATIVTADGLTQQVAVGAELVGTELNGLPVGTVLELVDNNLPFVETVVLNTLLTGGLGEESDPSFYSRATATLSSLNSTLVMPEDFQFAARAIPGVGRSHVLNLFDPAVPTLESAGHLSIAVGDAAGQPVSTELKAVVLEDLTSKALASLQLHLIDPTYTTVNITVTVQRAAGTVPTEVEAVVKAAITNWVDPAVWDWEPEVSQYALIAIVGSLAHVAMVKEASATVPLAGAAPLPVLGTVTVTVI